MKTAKRTIVASFVFFMFLCPLAHGEDSSGTKNWEFALAPLYLWAVNIDGEMTVKGQTQSLEFDFDEIFDKLEAAFTLHFEGLYKKKWGFLFDFSYINISDSFTTPGPGAANINLDFEDIMVELGGIYRFYEKGPHIFEGLGGARFTNLDAEIDITGGPPPTPQRIDAKQEWWDPILGLRYKWQISEKWMLNLRADIGAGFVAGDTSDSTWNAVGFISFQPWKHVGFLGGYRALDVDYETGTGIEQFKYDMLMHGLLMAVNITW